MEIEQESDIGAKRIVIGLWLAPGLAQEFRVEAIQRGIRLKELFGEMWSNCLGISNGIR
jgi:hypothetical protein